MKILNINYMFTILSKIYKMTYICIRKKYWMYIKIFDIFLKYRDIYESLHLYICGDKWAIQFDFDKNLMKLPS